MTDGRQVTLVLVDGGGSVLGALPPFGVDLPWWPEVGDVVAGARERFGVDVTVLRLLHADRPHPPGGSVTYLAQVPAAVAGLEAVDVTLAPDPKRAPYAEVGGPALSLAWAFSSVRDLGFGTASAVMQRKTWNLSALWQIATSSGTVWLKHLPAFMRGETAVLEWLGTVAPGAAPRLLAADGTGRQLITHLPGEDGFGAPLADRIAMAELLHKLQRRALDDLPGGVVDRRGPALHDQIVAAATPWLGEIPGLDGVLAALPARLAELAACGLPDTLVHGDFHPGNVRFSAAVPPAILDWGDAFLGNPAFDAFALAGGLDRPEAEALLAHWGELWRRVVPGADPVRAVELLRPVVALLGAVVYGGFVANIEPSEWPYHAADVPRSLREAVELG